jgi:hypothetical protein
MPLLTVGHGPQDRSALGARLTAAGVGRVVDVRRFPGSRSNPSARRSRNDHGRRDVQRERLVALPPAADRRRRRPGAGVPVTHLMPDGRLAPHRTSVGAVVSGGEVRWPAGYSMYG